MTRFRIPAVLLALGLASLAARMEASDLDREPINYATAPADNVVSRLQKQIASGQVKLNHADERGYLRSLLEALRVPLSSQVLVFSKTSLQRERISPRTPRALYFNDDVYVGYCQRGDVLEVSAPDANLGTAFYTLDQEPKDRPTFTRQTDNCLICHGASLSRGFPGHLVRSLYVDAQGLPILSAGSHATDHTSPFKERWGGWYVTGAHGRQTHMGNLIVDKKRNLDGDVHDPLGQNVTDLHERFSTGDYLTPHSDIVALMVLEHQAAMHNRLARAALETRMALHYQQGIRKALGESAHYRSESTTNRIRYAGDDVLNCLLFRDEAPLTDPIAGTSGFAEEFAARGPRDRQGRSLRDFDLKSRLFRHPCSHLIYSQAFDGMPGEVKDYVLRRLFDVLTGKDARKEFSYLGSADRRAILEILRETKPGLPAYWR